jgi:hypothetical protein
MNQQIFAQNIAALRLKDPVLAARLSELTLCSPRWKIVPTKKGLFTLLGNACAGKEILLHSKYDPVREAEQLVNSYEYSPTADIAFLGFGLAYHVEEVLKKPAKHGLILIVEADIEILWQACMSRDLRAVFGHPQVAFSVSENPASLFNRLTDHSMSVLANSLSLLEHPASVKCYEPFYAQVRKSFNDFYTWARVNANTQIAKARDFSRNILRNACVYIESPGINTLFESFRDVPTFIVSAGPSLDKNVCYLQEVGERGIILCVDSALKALLDNGITPDLIVSIDFGKNNVKYFDNIPSEKLCLVFDPEVYPDIPRDFRGAKFTMNLPGKALCDWITEKTGDKGQIPKGLSVSHAAFSIALAMHAGPIIFVGQDLSYPRGAWHSKGSGVYQKAEISQEVKSRFVTIDGYFGGTVQSETSFTVFLTQFESLLNGINVQCYNATEGGARIHGLENISLRDAIRRFCKSPIDKSAFGAQRPWEECRQDLVRLKNAALIIVEKLTEANHSAYQAYNHIEHMLTMVQKDRMNKKEVIESYKRVLQTVQKISRDQEVLNVLKDNAIEALILRSKREMLNINNISFDNKEPILRELQKEKSFFLTIVNACDFLTQEFHKTIEAIDAREGSDIQLKRGQTSEKTP